MDVSKLQNIAGLDEAFVSLYRMPLPDNNERIILANRVATANIPLLSTVSGLNPSQTSTLTLNAIDTTNLRNGCSKKFLRGINNGHPFVVGATSRLHLIAGCESNQLTELSSSIAEIDGATGTVSEITPARASGERAVEAGTCTRQIISYHYTPSNPLLVLRPCDANGDLLNQLMLVQFTQHDFVTKNLDLNISNLVAADVLNPLNADYWDDRALYSPRVAILRDRLGRAAVIARGKSYTNSESTTSYGKAYLLDGGYTQYSSPH